MRLRKAPEQAARCTDLRGSHRQGVVKAGRRRARSRSGVARRADRRHAAVPAPAAAQDGGRRRGTVVVRERPRLQDAGEHPLGDPGQGGVAGGRRRARPRRDKRMLLHLEGADDDGLRTVVPGHPRGRRDKKQNGTEGGEKKFIGLVQSRK